MVNVFIVHGAYGNPEENWIPWLKEALEKASHKVLVPTLPTPEGQTLENWLKVFQKYEAFLDKNSIVVGHSVGAAFLLNILEQTKNPIRAAFFVSGFTGLLHNPTFDEINRTIADRTFDWPKIRKNCRKFYVFHSNNDPYVPWEKAEELAANLETDVIVVEGAGHFNEKSGYTKFELLLEKIRAELLGLS